MCKGHFINILLRNAIILLLSKIRIVNIILYVMCMSYCSWPTRWLVERTFILGTARQDKPPCSQGPHKWGGDR